jgi:hypothetical protein
MPTTPTSSGSRPSPVWPPSGHPDISRISPGRSPADRSHSPNPLSKPGNHTHLDSPHGSVVPSRTRHVLVNPSGQRVTYFDNDFRFRELRPMQPRYNVKFDTKLLSRYYTCLQCCDGCCLGSNIQRTYMDVYPNKVELNRISACCLGNCCIKDHSRLTHYDRGYFHNPPKRASCMSPCFPFPCVNFCDICGEVVVFDAGCCRDNAESVPGFIRWCNGCCCVAAVYGLPEGEAEKVVDAVTENLEIFRESKAGMV